MSHIRKLVAVLACALLTTLSLTLVPAPASAQGVGRLSIEVSASNRDLPKLVLVALPWNPATGQWDWSGEQTVVLNPRATNPRHSSVDTMFPPGTWTFWLEDAAVREYMGGGFQDVGSGFPVHYGDGVKAGPEDRSPGDPGTFTLADEGESSVMFTYSDLHSLSGTVTTDGFPTAGAWVGTYVYFGGQLSYPLATRTDAEGRYAFTSLPAESVLPFWAKSSPPAEETTYLRDGSTMADYPGNVPPPVHNNVFMSSDQVLNFEFNGLNPAPVALVAPSIPATGKVGEPLALDRGTWSDTPQLTMQWMRNGVPIPGATADTYTPVAEDAGTNLTVVVTAKHPFNHPGTATTNAAAIAALPSPEPSPQPPAVTKAAPRVTVAKVARKRQVRITVTAPGVRPTGRVVVKVKRVRLGAVKLVKGKATLKVTKKKLRKVLKGKLRGKVKVSVTYSGDDFVLGRTVRKRVTFV